MAYYTLTITIDPYRLAATCIALLFFACLYNRWVENLENRGHDRGYMSLIVALGVAITGMGFALVTHLGLGLILLLCFVASGSPMILGSIIRYVRARARAEAERDHHAAHHLAGTTNQENVGAHDRAPHGKDH